MRIPELSNLFYFFLFFWFSRFSLFCSLNIFFLNQKKKKKMEDQGEHKVRVLLKKMKIIGLLSWIPNLMQNESNLTFCDRDLVDHLPFQVVKLMQQKEGKL